MQKMRTQSRARTPPCHVSVLERVRESSRAMTMGTPLWEEARGLGQREWKLASQKKALYCCPGGSKQHTFIC